MSHTIIKNIRIADNSVIITGASNNVPVHITLKKLNITVRFFVQREKRLLRNSF